MNASVKLGVYKIKLKEYNEQAELSRAINTVEFTFYSSEAEAIGLSYEKILETLKQTTIEPQLVSNVDGSTMLTFLGYNIADIGRRLDVLTQKFVIHIRLEKSF